MEYVEEALATVVKLAQQAGLGPLYIVGLLLAAAVLVVVAKRVVKLRPDSPPPPDPPAEWNKDPTQGAVVTPGPPGGTDDDVHKDRRAWQAPPRTRR